MTSRNEDVTVYELDIINQLRPPEPNLLYFYYMNGLAGTIIAIIGFLGNGVSIMILTRRSMFNSTAVLLIVMAVFDNVFLLFTMLIWTIPLIFKVHNIHVEYIHSYHFLFQNFYPVPHMAHTGTIYMTMLVTIERAMVVMRPLQAKYICTRRRAALISLGVVAWSMVYNIPRCLEFTDETKVQVDFLNNITLEESVQHKTEFGESLFYNLYYLVYFNSIFHFILPFLVISILNAKIIVRLLRRHQDVPRNQRRRLENESKLTIMILSLTAVFCICQLFAAVELVVLQVEKEECSLACERFSALAETMAIVNSATNFLLYSIFGEKFRRSCLRVIFIPWRTRPPEHLNPRTSQTLISSSYRGEVFQLRKTVDS